MNAKMTFLEFYETMRNARLNGNAMTGVIVYKESNWKEQCSLESRSYVVSNQCNYYDDDKISRAHWGTSLDKTDKDVRLDYYGWDVDYCYLLD